MRKRYFHRRNLPHLHYNEGDYFITFRLKDSLPSSEVQKLKEDLENSPEELSIKEKRLFKRYDELLDSKGFGSMTIIEEAIPNIIKEILYKYDGLYYELICYCIMPNHIHLVFTIISKEKSLSEIMKMIKGASSILINKYLNRTGSLWQAESFDRLIRDDVEMYNIVKYVLLNPVNANLVSDWKNWEHTYCHPSYLVLD
jgi:REP element-mobilizing transposase RayT